MSKRIIFGLLLLLTCTAFQACAGLQIGGGGNSQSAAAMAHHAQVRQSLDQLVSAYEGKNSRQFDDLVSDSYAGESSILSSAVRRDFSAYHNLSLRYTVNNITFDSSETKAFIAITFTRGWTDIKTTKTRNETKNTSLVFLLEKGTYKLYTQNRPLLFGLQ